MKNRISTVLQLLATCFSFHFLVGCSTQKQIGRQAEATLINNAALASAHVGISVYDPAEKKYLYRYNSDKYFIPASNVKLFTLWAGLKYLQDSIVAARVAYDEGTVIMQATGDPTFLHPDFKNQPLLDFLKRKEVQIIRVYTPFATTSFGPGWSWEDFQYEFMAERDPFPMYGNVATVIYNGDSIRTIPPAIKPFVLGMPDRGGKWELSRTLGGHMYTIDTSKGTDAPVKKITMAMDKGIFASRYLADTLHKTVITEYFPLEGQGLAIYSQSRDSVLKYMMYNSNNLFAEQTLLMAAEHYIDEMNDKRMIDTLLNTDLKDLPQRPKWVDGSGLSRYNLFTPEDLISILNRLQLQFGRDKIEAILPAGGEGTLRNMFKGYEQNIRAKTGTLSNNMALSGYLKTKSNRNLEFSILVNNHQAVNAEVRMQIEAFVIGLINNF